MYLLDQCIETITHWPAPQRTAPLWHMYFTTIPRRFVRSGSTGPPAELSESLVRSHVVALVAKLICFCRFKLETGGYLPMRPLLLGVVQGIPGSEYTGTISNSTNHSSHS